MRKNEKKHTANPITTNMKNIALFVSGNGTNCENIIRYFSGSHQIRIALVLSNKPDAYALTRARHLGIATEVCTKADFNKEEVLMPLLRKYGIDFIVLAGFLLMVPDFLIDAYDHRMINIHPALLPKFGGKGMYGHHVHEAVKAAGEKETGMTVHWVSKVCDGGEIIAQFTTSLSPEDTPDDIAEKEHQLEMKYFPEVIERLLTE
jgi:phosphoribosylglycinamide formyltransferase-1